MKKRFFKKPKVLLQLQYDEVIKMIEETSEAGYERCKIPKLIDLEVAVMLAKDGFDVLIHEMPTSTLSYSKVSWEYSEREKMGEITYWVGTREKRREAISKPKREGKAENATKAHKVRQVSIEAQYHRILAEVERAKIIGEKRVEVCLGVRALDYEVAIMLSKEGDIECLKGLTAEESYITVSWEEDVTGNGTISYYKTER
jgi:hypothetical protein